MRTLPAGMQSHLDERVTTLCWCWKLTRRDNVVLGFTDHDRDLTFGGTTYEASAGFTASAVQTDLGLNVPTMDIQGGLNSDALTEADLANGLWDNAVIELRRVNWADTSQALLMRKGTIGEVRRGDFTFTAELRGLAHELNQTSGRLYSYSCDADVGDARCKVNLAGGLYTGAGTVTTVLGVDRWFQVSGLDGFPNNWFTAGRVTWTTGDNVGSSGEVRLFTDVNGGRQVELWIPTGTRADPGDQFSITVGCDKQFGTCKYKFNNVANFRGFPWMPSNDRIIAYPDPDAVNDGGSLYGN